MRNKYLVVVDSEYVDACAIVDTPEGEFGGEGYVELKDSCELVLGSWEANTEEEAIEFAANDNQVSVEILTAYQLA